MLLLSHHPAWWGGDCTTEFCSQEYRLPSWPNSQPEGFMPRAVGLWNFSPWYSWPAAEALGWVSVVERLRLPSIQFLITTRRLYQRMTYWSSWGPISPSPHLWGREFMPGEAIWEDLRLRPFPPLIVHFLEKLSCREDCRFSTPRPPPPPSRSRALEEADHKR